MIKNWDVDSSKELTFDQQHAIKAFSLWLDESTSSEPFVLSGYAGTGKTFLSMKFLKLVDDKKICWTVAAPTHKAVGVLRTALEKERLRPTWYPSTIHRLLRLKIKRKGDQEICQETEQTSTSLEQFGLVVIDESSMIDKTLLEIILKCAQSFKTRLVFVGDSAQLPPVGEEKSSIFEIRRAVIISLEEVVRHQGPVLKLANGIRDGSFPCELPPCFPLCESTHGLVGSLERVKWLEQAKQSLKSSSDNSNPDEARILCYTNRVLETLVPHARRAIHGEMADHMPVLPGEILITRKAVLAAASVDGVDVGEEPDMLISSNREMKVLDITPEHYDLSECNLAGDFNYDFPVIDTLVARVLCGQKEFSLRLLPQVGTSSRRSLDRSLKRLSEIAKASFKKESKSFWRAFFLVRDSFASVGPASVLTVHRSQGSTFENVFVASDVFWPKELLLRKQLAYVAVSRASRQVWLVGDPEKHFSDDFSFNG